MRRAVKNRVVIASMMILLIVVIVLPDHRDHSVRERVWISPTAEFVSQTMARCDELCTISDYDDLFMRMSYTYDTDWCLMAAIAYVESRFEPHAISYNGAVGLMQIMPRTGVIYNLSEVDLLSPEANVMAGNMHFKYIEEMIAMPDSTTTQDRISLILASYNGGIGHLFDAQRLARRAGDDPHIWADVAPHLSSLSRREGYTNPVVRFGSFYGARYTIRYVDDVMAKYNEYRLLTASCRYHLYPFKLQYE